MGTKEELSRYLQSEFNSINEREGRSYSNPIGWRDLAKRMDIPENNLIRWKEGLNLPSNPTQIAALANEFGAEVLVILGLINRDLAWFMDHKSNTNVTRVLKEAKETAKKLVDGVDKKQTA